MIYNIVEGKTLIATQSFLAEDEHTPLVPKQGYPRVRLLDKDKETISEVIGSVGQNQPGQYDISIPVPIMGYTETTQLSLVWVFRDSNNDKTKVTDLVILEPSSQNRIEDIVVLKGSDLTGTLVLPDNINVGAVCTLKIFSGNSLVENGSFVLSSNFNSTASFISNGVNRTTVSFLIPEQMGVSFDPSMVIVSVVRPGAVPRNYTYKLWIVSPRMAQAVSFMEDFVNKSRIQNIIPELQYGFADMMSALSMGLSMFNGLSPQLTSFTGTGMAGALMNSWLLCAYWYVLNAQILAEGSLAFDFSGQGVSLNVDRTPQLDSALGRIESQIENTVKPMKKLLVKAGIVGGDGSNGANIGGAANSAYAASRNGITTVINAPTTQFRRGMGARFR